MKQSMLPAIAGLFAILSLNACKRKDDPKCPSGNGGNITIVAYPQHHGKAARPYMAYLKYGTKEAPTNLNAYDFTKAADTTEDHIELPGLKCGDYYIYMTGYDTSIKAGVKGGIPYSLSEMPAGEVNVNIPITE